ncbi:MAG: DUF4157 domain-containing protein [Phycisphaerales bacterium]|nr:DUF4157 domain-containing protein [Phycisphaerales bacterium]
MKLDRSGAAAAGGKSAEASAPAASPRPGPGKVAADFAGIKAHGTEHAGHGANAAAHGMNAKAFAAGNDAHFAKAGNLNTMAHEAAHVAQQGGVAS